jgi:hypothetical protein
MGEKAIMPLVIIAGLIVYQHWDELTFGKNFHTARYPVYAIPMCRKYREAFPVRAGLPWWASGLKIALTA